VNEEIDKQGVPSFVAPSKLSDLQTAKQWNPPFPWNLRAWVSKPHSAAGLVSVGLHHPSPIGCGRERETS
jgi:hypothetical protein